MSAPERKRVFILGAGFSKAAGMPLASELTESLLTAKFLRDAEGFKEFIESLRSRIATADRSHTAHSAVWVNIEQVFDLAKFDHELWLMRQHASTATLGETALEKSRRIGFKLSWLEAWLPGVLLDAEERANPPAMDSFSRCLREGDAIMTFNYDTLLERSLGAGRTTWSHGFPSEARGAVTILKLHGSVDWWHVPPDRQDGCKQLFRMDPGAIDGRMASWDPELYTLQNDRVLSRVSDLAKAREFWNEYRNPLLATTGSPRPGLGGLGAHKPLHRLIGSGVVWINAFKALNEADEIYVIGWSASPYDTMARFYFASVLNHPECKPKRVVVVDPKVCEQITNYRAIFGKVESIGQCAERVDWDSLLGR